MSNERETLADIVADLRAKSRKFIGYHGVGWFEGGRFMSLADRIESAWRRERESVTKCNWFGNAAAMREALENCSKMGEQIDYQLGSSDETVFALRHERCLAHNISECARAALSAPARNCDKFVTQPEMSRAYEEYRKSAMKNYGNGLTGRFPTVKQKPMTYDEWLLAPAAERKGEN